MSAGSVTAYRKSSTGGPRRAVPGSLRGALAACALILLAGCQADELGYGAKAERPLSFAIKADMTAKDMSPEDPILIRLFKEESKLEVWKRTKSGRYALLKDYDVCKWSGKLGPKKKEGDRQAPEGFYTIHPSQMNPNSSYHLSFNTGFPNAYDRAYGRTGSNLMVHGACSSRGCYAMTDEQIQEIYSLAREAFRGGQRAFQFEAFPFRMTAENMARHTDDDNYAFWRMLKAGYDHFEITKQPPKVDVCDKQYVFNAKPEDANARFVANRACPAYSVPESVRAAVDAKEKNDDRKIAMIASDLRKRQEREEKWKNGDTALSKLFGPGNEAGDSATQADAAPNLTPALAYSRSQAATGAGREQGVGGDPLPVPNPQRPHTAGNDNSGEKSSGFFTRLFTGSAKPGSPIAPATQRPAANRARAARREPATAPGSVPVPASAPARDGAAAQDNANRGSAVSNLVSRWFSLGTKKN